MFPYLLQNLPTEEAKALAERVNRSRTARAWGVVVIARPHETGRGSYLVLNQGESALGETETYRRAEGFVHGLYFGES